MGGIDRAIQFLRATQQTDGSFLDSSGKVCPTLVQAEILAALSNVPQAASICRKLAQWLMGQKSSQWTFNYWPRTAAGGYANSSLLPDDLDTTFAALIGLWRQGGSGSIGAEGLGAVVRLLVASEQQVGGPYIDRVATRPPIARLTSDAVDAVTNSRIACFLALAGSELPNLASYLDTCVRQVAWQSSRYATDYPSLYYVVQARRESPFVCHRLTRELLSRRKQDAESAHWGSPLQTAFASLALQAANYSDGLPVQPYLYRQQASDGSWPAEDFCTAGAQQGHRGKQAGYCRSAALTTAFVLEVLVRSPLVPGVSPSNRSTLQPSAQASEPDATHAERLFIQIQQASTRETAVLAPDVRRTAQALLRRTQQLENSHEIALLPYMFAQSLVQPQALPDEFYKELGLANTYGWLAYTIFDDFLDDEGNNEQLPVASLALRRSLAHFEQALPGNEAFTALVRQSFDHIDAANAWEQVHCRFVVDDRTITFGTVPNYAHPRRLYERSIGHALTPLAVLVACGEPLDSQPAKLVARALYYYLAARQLLDDLHDWEADCRAGHVSYVVAAIMQDLALAPGAYAFAELLPQMQDEFWHRTLPRLCGTSSSYIKTANQALRRSSIVRDDAGIAILLRGLGAILERTLQEQQQSETFLAGYRGDS